MLKILSFTLCTIKKKPLDYRSSEALRLRCFLLHGPVPLSHKITYFNIKETLKPPRASQGTFPYGKKSVLAVLQEDLFTFTEFLRLIKHTFRHSQVKMSCSN